MQVITNKYLKYIDLVILENWSVQGLLDSKFNYSNKYEQASIGDFLIKSRSVVNIEDDVVYTRVTVKINNNGVIQRDKETGVNIGTKKQYLAKAGQFIISKIDARNGAFGIIPNELDGSIVTNDFPLFNVNEKRINSRFLLLITTTREFIKFAQSCSSGTTNRQRMDIDLFLKQKIPLPSLLEQNKIVDNYDKKLKEASELLQQSNILENEIENFLTKELGIEYLEKKSRKGLYFIDFKKIERWDLWNSNEHFNNSTHNILKLNSLIKLKSGNFLPASKMVNGEYIVYGGNGESGRHNEYLLEGKRLVIGRVGEYCGNVHLIEGKYWITDNAFIVDKISENVTYEYLEIALNFLKLNKYRVVSAQPSISQGAILNLDFPTPPLSKQQQIVEAIQSMRIKLKNLKSRINLLKFEAQKEFEKTIFNS